MDLTGGWFRLRLAVIRGDWFRLTLFPVYRTDLSGNIVMKTDGEKLSVTVDAEVSQDNPMLWEPGKKNR